MNNVHRQSTLLSVSEHEINGHFQIITSYSRSVRFWCGIYIMVPYGGYVDG